MITETKIAQLANPCGFSLTSPNQDPGNKYTNVTLNFDVTVLIFVKKYIYILEAMLVVVVQ